MTRHQTQELLAKAKDGRLSPRELAETVSAIGNVQAESEADLYTLLHIVGRASTPDAHADIVAPYVAYRDDPQVAALALKILCLWWNDAEDHLPEVRAALEGHDWDEDQDVQLTACTISGEYLRHHRHPPLLRALIAVVEDEETLPAVREHAEDQLARGLGYSHQEVLTGHAGSGPLSRPRLLQEARSRLADAQRDPGSGHS